MKVIAYLSKCFLINDVEGLLNTIKADFRKEEKDNFDDLKGKKETINLILNRFQSLPFYKLHIKSCTCLIDELHCRVRPLFWLKCYWRIRIFLCGLWSQRKSSLAMVVRREILHGISVVLWT